MVCSQPTSASADDATRELALDAARKATRFYWKTVSTLGQGGYLWRYSVDLKLREGEGKASKTMAWVQPPGTPSMGEAFTRLYEATGDELFRDAALASADVLRRGQLRSGGWNEGIDLDPKGRTRQAYRVEPLGRKRRNYSSLDDDQTQSAIRLLVRVDKALDFKHAKIH